MSNRWPGKTVVGLTGNIATGKSVVRRMLEHLGAFGVDADGLAHKAMSPGAPAYQPVVNTFGRWLLTPEGQIDRNKLAVIVFSDKEALERLEALVHPIVVQVVDILVKRAKQPVVALEAIKLLETGLADECDALWVVTASEDVQLQRLMEVRKLSAAEAAMRIQSQPPQSEKIARADVVIDNAGGYEETWEQVQKHWLEMVGVPAPPPEPRPIAVAPTAPGAPPTPAVVVIHRGGPGDAVAIATFLNTAQGSQLTRADILMRFGEKAYMLAKLGDTIVGLVGWQVENLITRMDEFVLAPQAPVDETARGMIESVETASHELQSEVSLLFVPQTTSEAVLNAIKEMGYEPRQAHEIKVPDWREAAEEGASPDSMLMAKKLREDRVLRPL